MSTLKAKRSLSLFLALCLALLPIGLAACAESTDDAADANVEDSEAQTASVTAHGSEYGKTETVQASSTLEGKITDIAVEEWIKNPDELDDIADESSLQQIASENEDVTFTQDGESLQWKADGQDIHYSGITDQELPFSISYSYKLDGKKVKPSELEGATGKLKICISYTNNTSATVNTSSGSHDVQQPYALATIMSLDAEHASNVSVDNGQVVDQDGSFIVAGVAMPGLAKSLGLEDQVELPEKVTISADVTGFEMPSITTMASNQVLGAVKEGEGTVDESIDDLFSQTSTITNAIDKLSQGTSAISSALDQINQGQEKLGKAFPTASDGAGKLITASEGIGKLVDGSKSAVDAAAAYEAAATQQIAALKNIDQSNLTDEQKAALSGAVAGLEGNLAAAQQYSAASSKALEQASGVSSQLTSGIKSIKKGLKQIQAGHEKLEAATGKVSDASVQLDKGVKTMSSSISRALSQARGTIEDKLDLVSALADCAEAEGAFCGNASDMPATTTFIVTAKA